MLCSRAVLRFAIGGLPVLRFCSLSRDHKPGPKRLLLGALCQLGSLPLFYLRTLQVLPPLNGYGVVLHGLCSYLSRL